RPFSSSCRAILERFRSVGKKVLDRRERKSLNGAGTAARKIVVFSWPLADGNGNPLARTIGPDGAAVRWSKPSTVESPNASAEEGGRRRRRRYPLMSHESPSRFRSGRTARMSFLFLPVLAIAALLGRPTPAAAQDAALSPDLQAV